MEEVTVYFSGAAPFFFTGMFTCTDAANNQIGLCKCKQAGLSYGTLSETNKGKQILCWGGSVLQWLHALLHFSKKVWVSIQLGA